MVWLQTTRLAMIKAMDGSERGEQFWMDTVRTWPHAFTLLRFGTRVLTISVRLAFIQQQHYFKAHAYRVEPLARKGYLSIDGEAYPHETFEAEVHQGLGTFLSMYGHYMNDFDLPPDDK